jgi:hypothetical protein
MGVQAGRESSHRNAQDGDARWVEPVRWCALAVFLALPIFAFLVPRLAGRVVWTVCIALLPLFIVLGGYHPWRRICPLAWFAQLPARLGRPGERRASSWLQANYYYVVFAVFIVSLWLRLVATNGDGPALGSFLVLISLAALLSGVFYTGKTWCNYLCPVSFVEKVYTEPRGLRPTSNSQCAKCTACKSSCPDINQENGYWKEILSPPKRGVYFAFPGLVFSFYFYYYLQAGTWEYYFGGAWTHEPYVFRRAFFTGYDAHTAGFYFLPAVPRAAAALLTLLLGALLSFALFSVLERAVAACWRRRQGNPDDSAVRHQMLTVTAFAAFITFYTFAGAPTIRLLSGAPHLFQILVVATGTLFLARRLTRRQQAFAEETLARQIIRRWEWADVPPPKNLREALVLHTIRSQTQAGGYVRLLETYKEAVREAVASGLVSRAEVQRLESLRAQLQISQADHEKIMADLAEEERARIADPLFRASAEKRLQLESYAQALQSYLGGVSQAGAVPDDSIIRHLRQEYAVTPEEHAAVLDDLLGKGQAIAAHVAKAFELAERAAHTFRLIGDAPSSAGAFLADVLTRKQARAVDDLMRGFGCDPQDESFRNLRGRLLADDDAVREAAVEALGAHVGPAVAVRLREARREAARAAHTSGTIVEAAQALLGSAAPYVRVAALYLLGELHGADDDTLTALARDEHEVLRETALCLFLRGKGLERREETGLVTVEKMIALRAVPLFSSLAPEDLASLARASRETEFSPGAALCVEGEPGDEVFILLAGEVKVLRQVGAEQKQVGNEKAGGFIGEMAVLDPGPRAATVVAGPEGTRVLRLSGGIFREVLRANPSVVQGVIRALVGRVRGAQAPARGDGKSQPVSPGSV